MPTIWHHRQESVAVRDQASRLTPSTRPPLARHVASISAPHGGATIVDTRERTGGPDQDKESHHMNRVFASILLVVVLVVGGGVIATAAYQAGVNNAVTTTTQNGTATVTPVVVRAYGYGIGFWHPFGWIFGFFAT